jgi:glycosyltransferase involved in cell wall biosynthesis
MPDNSNNTATIEMPTHSLDSRPSLVLITPARNEAANLPRLIEVMIGQTLRPAIWLIVNDGSTDDTEAIVRGHLSTQPWMRLVSLPATRERSFAAKATCFMEGYRQLPSDSDLVGNLDADVSFDSDYLEFLVDRFAEDRTLGVAGTPFTEPGYDSTKDSFEGETHVPGGCQIFRRECFDEIDGYKPSPIGVDWIAVTTARSKGWRTRSFRDRMFRHHRPLGTAGRSRLRAAFFYGEKDHILGWHPLYELARITFQTARDPIAGGCIAAGYITAVVRRLPRAVTPELAAFHRAEQLAKLGVVTRRFFSQRRHDHFRSPVD